MLRELHIRDLGVIEDAVLGLVPGLTVLTGETGAGKTMVVSGLGLVLGGRADPDLVRAGCREALIEASVEVSADHPARRRAAEAGADPDEPELILARTVASSGRSRAHVGGRRAPVGTLTELAEDLVAVHGQADQWRLRRPAQHRALLDAYAGESVAGVAAEFADLFARWREARRQRDELVEGERTRLQRLELLGHQVEQIEAVAPQPGEDAELAAEEERLGHAEELATAAELGHRLLSDPDSLDGDDVVGRLARAGEQLGRIAEHDRALGELQQRLGEIGVLAADLAGELSGYAADIEVDPARLAAVQERRARLTGLTRRYGEDVAAVLAHRDAAREELAELEGADERVAELDEEVDQLQRRLLEVLQQLTAAREAAAERLSAVVGEELARLGMPGAVVEVVVGPRGEDGGEELPDPGHEGGTRRIGPDGGDVVEIRVAANKGTKPRTVSKAASGGELSRIMLAIEVAVAGTGRSQVPTFVFDEVDAGVGGRAALDVGARLAALARTSQVIVVTHLAQVAAHADRHLVVRKAHGEQVTSSDVLAVDGEDRLAELSRMMGGGDTAAGLRHARELLEQCHAVE